MAPYFSLALTFASLGIVMLACQWAFRSRWSANRRIHEGRSPKIVREGLAGRMLVNSSASTAFVFGLCFLADDWMFAESAAWYAPVLALVQAVAVLIVYDFLYYFVHRFVFHEWPRLREIHVVHHTVKNPTAFDSMYMHPVENLTGLGLLIGSTCIVGPVEPLGFAIAFFVYSYLNVLIHCGMVSRRRLLRPISFMVRKHARHHQGMRSGNYASITPLPDLLFGTLE